MKCYLTLLSDQSQRAPVIFAAGQEMDKISFIHALLRAQHVCSFCRKKQVCNLSSFVTLDIGQKGVTSWTRNNHLKG